MARPVSLIDQMPATKRQAIIDRLLAGEPLRSVAQTAGISFQALGKYRQRVVLPALRAASKLETDRAEVMTRAQTGPAITALTKEIALGSPFRSRLESIYQRIERQLDKAESAEKAEVMPAFLSQAHKNLELLARATGELGEAAGPSTTNNVLNLLVMPMPAAPALPGKPAVDALPDPPKQT